MARVYLRVTYQVAAHDVTDFERALNDKVLPLASELEIRLEGIWKTSVGRVGEYLELWSFDSFDEFDRKWGTLMAHPRLQETFKTTSPMVRDEQFSLLSPVISPATES